MSQPLERTAPEAQSVSSQAVLNFIDAVEASVRDMHSFMLLRRGAVIAEGWWKPYQPEIPHILYSLSKSFTSTAVGLAAAEDLLDLDDPVIAFFPEALPAQVSPNLSAMRVRHLLSMSTGHAENTSDLMMEHPESWERVFFAQPVDYPPGTHFVYNNGATYMLSAILHRLTGQDLVEYLTPRLLAPLGIATPTWEKSPRGVSVGFKGLRLKTEDIARFGQLYLNRGVWQGQRILPEEWVDTATASHVDNDGGEGPIDWRQGYGFQFWRCRHNAYRGDGAFGQFCVVMPEQQAVLAINSGVADMQGVLEQVWEHLLPALQPAESLPANPAAEVLARRLVALEIQPPQSALSMADQHTCFESIAGRSYRLEPNMMGYESIAFQTTPDGLTLAITAADEVRSTLHCGLERWQTGVTGPYLPYAVEMRMTSGFDLSAPAVAQIQAAASARWAAPDVLEITTRYIETPFVQTQTFTFHDNRVTVATLANVSFGPLEAPRMEGARE